MKNYIFLTDRNAEYRETVYYAISPERIEEMDVADTYDNYGQIVGHYDAGDYHFDNSACDAIKDCIREISQKFNVDAEDIHITDDDGDFIIEPGDGEEYDFPEEEVNTFIKKWREENEFLTTCKGFTYWDGHNWKSILVSAEFFDTDFEIVEDEQLISDLETAIEEKEFVKEGFGQKIYEANGYVVIDNYCEGTWEAYRIMPTEEYESASI